MAVLQAEPELQDTRLAPGKRGKDRLDLLLEELVGGCLSGWHAGSGRAPVRTPEGGE